MTLHFLGMVPVPLMSLGTVRFALIYLITVPMLLRSLGKVPIAVRSLGTVNLTPRSVGTLPLTLQSLVYRTNIPELPSHVMRNAWFRCKVPPQLRSLATVTLPLPSLTTFWNLYLFWARYT